MTKLCAEAMGWHTGKRASKIVAYPVSECAIVAGNDRGGESVWDPLHDDDQAMSLAKRLKLRIEWYDQIDGRPAQWWRVDAPLPHDITRRNASLNRAICKCVAKMQQAKSPEVSP